MVLGSVRMCMMTISQAQVRADGGSSTACTCAIQTALPGTADARGAPISRLLSARLHRSRILPVCPEGDIRSSAAWVVSLETANFRRLAWALLHKAIADQAQAKLKVDRAALLQRHGISAGEFAKITSSMTDLCFDVLVRSSPPSVSI